MKCVLCKTDLVKSSLKGALRCPILLRRISSHYYVSIVEEMIAYQGYVIDKYFVQVHDGKSVIFLDSDNIMNQIVSIPRSLWINSENIEATLTTIKMCVCFS